MPSLVRIEPLTEGPMRPGSEWRETRRIFKREATEQFEVTTMEPPRHLGLRVDGTKGASTSAGNPRRRPDAARPLADARRQRRQ
jgi:hypothetical protein